MLMMFLALVVLVVQYRGVSQSQELITTGYLPLAKTVARLTTWQSRIDNDIQSLLGDEARPASGDRSITAIYAEELAVLANFFSFTLLKHTTFESPYLSSKICKCYEF